MNKLIIAGVLVAAGFAGLGAAAPASAAPLALVPYCSSTTADISGDASLIKQQLRGAGYDAQSVEEWNGCVRAYIANGSGGEHMAYFDPDTLAPIATLGEAQG